MKKPVIQSVAVMFWLLMLSACATLTSDVDPPKVTMESFRSIASESGTPRFEIKLRVTNPNKQPLDVAGIGYSVEIQGKELVSGVTNDVPLVEAYSEEMVTLEASLQLFQLLRLVTSLATVESDALAYRFSAKIDFKGFTPTQRIEETGTISLDQLQAR